MDKVNRAVYTKILTFALALTMVFLSAMPAVALTAEIFSYESTMTAAEKACCAEAIDASEGLAITPKPCEVVEISDAPKELENSELNLSMDTTGTLNVSEVASSNASMSLAIERLSGDYVTVRFDFYVGSFLDFSNDVLTSARHVHLDLSRDEYRAAWGDCRSKDEIMPAEILRRFPETRYFFPKCQGPVRCRDAGMTIFRFHVEPHNNLTMRINIAAESDGGRFFHWQGPCHILVDGFRYGRSVRANEILSIVQSETSDYADLFESPVLYPDGTRSIRVDQPRGANIAEVRFPLKFAERTLTFYVFEFSEDSTLTAETTETARGSFTTTLDVALSLNFNRICGSWIRANLADYSDYWRSDFPLDESRYVGDDTIFLIFREGACPICEGYCTCGYGGGYLTGHDHPPPPPNVGNNTDRRERTDDTSIVATVGPQTGDVVAPPFAYIAVLAALVVVVTSVALVRSGGQGVRKGNRLVDRLVAVLRVYET